MSSAAVARMQSLSSTRSTGATKPSLKPEAMTAAMSGSGHSAAALSAAGAGAESNGGSSSELQSCTGLNSRRPGGLQMQACSFGHFKYYKKHCSMKSNVAV